MTKKQWQAGDLAEIGSDRCVEVMYTPKDGRALVRDINLSYREMSDGALWLWASAGDGNAVAEIRHRSDPSLPAPLPGCVVSAGDGNAVAEIRHRSDPSLPAPLPGCVVSFVSVDVLRPATITLLTKGL